MQLIKNQALSVDRWHYIDDETPLSNRASILSPERFRRDRAELIESNRPIGMRLTADHIVEEIVEELPFLDLIALDFTVFTDGRHYSNAHLLRERYGYRGDIRATGDVLQDQLLFMRRCGFTSFELQDPAPSDVLNAFSEFSVFYQKPATTTVVSNLTQAN